MGHQQHAAGSVPLLNIYVCVRLLYHVTRFHQVKLLIGIWNSDKFHEKHRKLIPNLKQVNEEVIGQVQWKEPKLIMKCLLVYFK